MATRVTSTFGDLLRQYRLAAGLTQDELAERANLSVRGISDLERGVKQAPHRSTVQMLADALQLGGEDRAALEASIGRRRGPASSSDQGPSRLDLPVPPTPFIGRQREVEEVRAMLLGAEVRLLTLTGPGGVGKTRLALRVAEPLGERFPDGVTFVSLAALSDPALVASTIAARLGLQEVTDRPILESMADHLREKRFLLVLDNFEHLLPAAEVVSRLVDLCRRLTILITSRSLLHLSAERSYPVPPLPVPTPGHLPELKALPRYDAVDLFLRRAQTVRPDFRLTDENAAAVAEICSRLDGLPLAIELVAARIRHLSPGGLLTRLSDRLQLLTGGPRDVPARQQTLRSTIDWSYRLLSPDEQALFARLSVFAGGSTMDAAEAVCCGEGTLDVLEGLASLVDMSLLRQEEAVEPRFGMLDTTREYGLERLQVGGEEETIRRRHAEWVLRLVEEAEPELRGPDQVEWQRRLEAELNNVRAALTWAKGTGALEVGLRIGSALERFYFTHGLQAEGRAWLEELLALDEQQGGVVDPRLRAAALLQASKLARTQGDARRAAELAEEGLQVGMACGDRSLIAYCSSELGPAILLSDTRRATALLDDALTHHSELGDTWGVALTLKYAAMAASARGDYRRAAELTEQCLVLWEHFGDRLNLALALLKLGDLALVTARDLPAAARLYEKSLEAYGELGHRGGMGHALASLADVALQQGDRERAEELAEESLAYLRAQGERHITGWATRILGEIVLSRGDVPRALALMRESLRLANQVGDLDLIAAGLEEVAAVDRAGGQGERAVHLYAAASALRDGAEARPTPQHAEALGRAVAALRRELGEERFVSAWERGRAMSREEAVAYAMADAVASSACDADTHRR